jgi:hypothetical protein
MADFESCRCRTETLVTGINESDSYSRHMTCEVMGSIVGRYRCPATQTIWRRVWGVGQGHGFGPARIEKVPPETEADAFRYMD